MKLWQRFFACAWLVMCTGCAVHRYRPASVSIASSLAIYEAKSLDDPALKTFLQSEARQTFSSWPLRSWTLEELTYAAYYYNPELDTARANVASAEAASVTAGARPNPSIGVGGGYATSPESPYLWNIDFTVPIETAHKRGYRMLEARQLSEASRIALAESGWQVRTKVRTALLEYLNAQRQADALRLEERGRSEQVRLLEQRLKAGEIGRPELNTANLDLANARLALQLAEGAVNTTRSGFAAAIGIPLSALDGHQFVWPNFEIPRPVSTANVRREAALNRLDLRQAAAEFEASDANLRLQIAKQYPDLQLGPHADHQEGFNNFSLGVVLELPLLNRNQGPIAEAEAHRTAAAAKLRTLQSSALAEADSAVAEYQTALRRLYEARQRLRTVQDRLTQQAEHAVKSGEEDRSYLVSVQIQDAITQRAVIEALHNTQTALIGLESAMQAPLEGNATPLRLSEEPVRNSKQGGSR